MGSMITMIASFVMVVQCTCTYYVILFWFLGVKTVRIPHNRCITYNVFSSSDDKTIPMVLDVYNYVCSLCTYYTYNHWCLQLLSLPIYIILLYTYIYLYCMFIAWCCTLWRVTGNSTTNWHNTFRIYTSRLGIIYKEGVKYNQN